MPAVAIRGVPFEHQLSCTGLTEAVERINKSWASTKIWTKRLHNAIQEKNEAKQTEARDWLLYSPEATLAAAVIANTKLRPEKRKHLEHCLGLPGKLDLSKPLPEIVRVFPKPKKSAGLHGQVAYRALHDYGLLHRTAQALVMRVLGLYFIPRNFQYTHLGVQTAIARVKEFISAGYVFSTRLDIEDFYMNFSADALITKLPLPKEVVEYAVCGRFMKVMLDQGKNWGSYSPYFSPHACECLLLQARQGIPQGSASSPIIGMMFVSRLVWFPMLDVVLLNYADDFLLLAKSPDALKKSIKKLTSAVSKLPGGHFKLRLEANGSAKSGVDFLGHTLKIVNGKVNTKPTEANLNYAYSKLDALEEHFGKLVFPYGQSGKSTKKAIKCVAEQYAFVKGWIAAFGECDDKALQWTKLMISKVDESLAIVGMSEEQIEKFVEPWMGYKPGDYSLGL